MEILNKVNEIQFSFSLLTCLILYILIPYFNPLGLRSRRNVFYFLVLPYIAIAYLILLFIMMSNWLPFASSFWIVIIVVISLFVYLGRYCGNGVHMKPRIPSLHFITQAGLKLLIVLLQHSEYWNLRCALPRSKDSFIYMSASLSSFFLSQL